MIFRELLYLFSQLRHHRHTPTVPAAVSTVLPQWQPHKRAPAAASAVWGGEDQRPAIGACKTVKSFEMCALFDTQFV